MKTRILFYLFALLIAVPMANAQYDYSHDLGGPVPVELQNQIRRDKFDIILPQVMQENNIDMWIHVIREVDFDPFGSNLGSDVGVFIFTDRGGDRIERAVFGNSSDLVEECGAYDIIVRPDINPPLNAFPKDRMYLAEFFRRGGTEWPGGPKTELDFRFKGVGEFVAERDPKRIAVNYLEKLGSAVLYDRLSLDGISHTDYNLLVKALGDKYAEKMVSSEYLVVDYISRPVESELEIYKKIRAEVEARDMRDINKIVPGVTNLNDLERRRSVTDKNGNRRRGDDIIQRGDLIMLGGGRQETLYPQTIWKYGNYYEFTDVYAYVLLEGDTQPPPKIKRIWSDALKVRKILEDNIKMGRTGDETYDILKLKLAEAGFINNDRQQYYKDLDPEKTQVALDLHAGSGIEAPRIGPLGSDWQRDIKLPLNHHFYFEYFIYVLMPEWGEGRYISLRFHDGAIVTERGVEYFFPPPTELHLIN